MATVAITALLGLVVALIFWALHKWIQQVLSLKKLNILELGIRYQNSF